MRKATYALLMASMAVLSLATAGNALAADKYKIGVSLPAPAVQWVSALIDYAQKEAKKAGDDYDIKIVVSGTPAAQVSAIEDLMQDQLDAMVVFPIESAPVTPICERIYDAGVPLLILTRGINSDKFNCELRGDDKVVGIQAAHYIGRRLNGKGNVVMIQAAPCAITQLRTEGFMETIEKYYPSLKVVATANGNFAREPALKAMEDILQAQDEIDAVYSQDDEQALGIMLAIQDAGREDEMFVTGVGGNKAVIEQLMDGNELMGATFTYPATMGGSAIRIAKKMAKGEGLTETLEKEVPREIILTASTVTSDNAKKFYDKDSSY
ncbi:MAG: LacI family transcriptional regulator [Spartobacteria bacterium]|nr:LacI family transcriptional regulator [Spartobacteria bacterium]